ncbi:hypothetical protein JCM18882A_28010 [Brevibacterium metallidurans]|uniref:Uncharacterized protein n=1 Tax=Brevibacterium metallidurans TaxID=1482676 RepID=A0ABP3CAJ9_9MICO
MKAVNTANAFNASATLMGLLPLMGVRGVGEGFDHGVYMLMRAARAHLGHVSFIAGAMSASR